MNDHIFAIEECARVAKGRAREYASYSGMDEDMEDLADNVLVLAMLVRRMRVLIGIMTDRAIRPSEERGLRCLYCGTQWATLEVHVRDCPVLEIRNFLAECEAALKEGKVGRKRIRFHAWPEGCGVPGTWHGGKKPDGKRTASMCCPDCKKVASLSGHEIDSKGNVSPSVVCPRDGCKFHEWVTLEGWVTLDGWEQKARKR